MIAKKETPKGLLFKSSNFCGFQILEQNKVCDRSDLVIVSNFVQIEGIP